MFDPNAPINNDVSDADKAHRLALVVGVNNSVANYKHTLKYAERDASSMALMLEGSQCNFTLIDTLRGQEARTRDIQQAIKKLVEGRTDKDFLLFYFSGHAQQVTLPGGHKDIYLITHDFNEADLEFGIPHISRQWLLETLYQKTIAGAVLLILDCCYAGNIIHTEPDPYHIDVALRKLVDEVVYGSDIKVPENCPRMTLTATGYDVTADEGDGHGRMTTYILQALSGQVDKADENEIFNAKGQVDIQSLHRYLKKKIPEQFPNLKGEVGQHSWVLATHPRFSASVREQVKNDELTSQLGQEVGKNILSELLKLYAQTQHTQPFDYSICYTASFSDLDLTKVTEFFKQDRFLQEMTFHHGISDQGQLQQLSFLQQDRPTYGALLCFGHTPSQWVAGATTRCVEWDGNDDSGNLRSSREYRGALLSQFEFSRDFLRKSLRLGRNINSEGSTEKWEIPLRVLDEALANALVHREYVNRTDCVHVEVFDDRVEISNPGVLPQDVTLELLKTTHGSHPRNPQIAGIFYLHNHIERLGRGIQRMQRLMKEAGLQEPEFEVAGDKRFKVILSRPRQTGDNLERQLAFSLPQASATPPIWDVPFRRNPFFTGRESLLKQLHDRLISTRTAALTQAISGLGGIGKTQTALEYAHRYREEYHYVFWASAASRDTLISDFVKVATLLKLLEKNEQDQNVVVFAVKRWLTEHGDWLLILDNADDLEMVAEFLPTENQGHIILTTRAQSTGKIARSLEVEKMELEEGSLLLLRRTNLLAPDAPLAQASQEDRTNAEAIVREMDGLPLALDQAGAYIEETGRGLSGYLDLYKKRRADLLKRKDRLSPEYPNTVATTWALSFQQVEQANPAAVELVRLCAFLAPDAIPEEIITAGASYLGPVLSPVAADPLAFNDAVEVLRRYSLVRRNVTMKTLTIHRLVQAVLKDGMDNKTQRKWAERAVRAVEEVFPEVKVETWQQCERHLPHALICAALIEQWELAFQEAARLLNHAGEYLLARGLYAQVEPLYQQALAIREKTLGPEHPDIAQSLNNLARLYEAQGKYAQAEPLYQHALAIREKTLGPKHPDVAQSLNNLARLYDVLGQYNRAETLYQHALAIDEQALGSKHPDVATDLNNLALLYYNQGEHAKAEPLYQRALAIDEQTLGPEHPDVATDLNNLALLYQTQGKYIQAEPLLQRALTIKEKALGSDHPNVATSLNNLAGIYESQGKYNEAEPLYRQALVIFEKTLGPEHPIVATALENYAQLLRKTNREAEALKLEERSRTIRMKYAQENPTE